MSSKESIRVTKVQKAGFNGPSSFELTPNNARPQQIVRKEVIIKSNPYGPNCGELVPQNQ